MNKELFKNILLKEESVEIDFKKEHYKLIGGKDEDTAKFVKDIVSFSNTIRENSAFIILGVLNENDKKELLGINNPIDDNILQAKIKDKVYPRPHFKYLNFEYENLVFGIIEIPLRRYIEPIMPTVKMKGLEVGKIYCRQGSTNVEANGREIIELNKWITTLPENIDDKDIIEKISDLISRISADKEPLSVILSEGLKIGKLTNDDILLDFCKSEIDGYYEEKYKKDGIPHRNTKVIMSPYIVDKVQGFSENSVEDLWRDLKSKENFYEVDLIFNDSIHKIEKALNDFKTKGLNSFSKEQRLLGDFFNDKEFGDAPLYIYYKFDNFNSLYHSIKRKFTSILMDRIK